MLSAAQIAAPRQTTAKAVAFPRPSQICYRTYGWHVVRLVAATSLIIAAALKTDDLYRQALIGSKATNSLIGPAFLIIGEWLLGFWLISNAYSKVARKITLVVFATFFVYSSYLAISNAPSCNCFGHVRIPPLWTALFDLTVIGLLLANPIESCVNTKGTLRRLVLSGAFPAILGAFGVCWAVIAFSPQALPVGNLAEPGSAVFLRPADWNGQQFPLTPYLDDGNSLLKGDWIITLHKKGCPLCEDSVTKMYTIAYEKVHTATDGLQFAVITFPVSEDADLPPHERSGLVQRRQASSQYQWDVPTPTTLRVSNGLVISSSVDLESLLVKAPTPNTDNYQRIAWSGGMPDYPTIRKLQRRNSFACGPFALLAILESMNRRPDESSVRTMIEAAGEKGTDFAILREMAESQGLNAIGVITSIPHLRQMGFPAIVHFDNSGFVGAIGYVAGGVRVAVPSGQIRVMPDDVFAAHYGTVGRALLISDQRIPNLPVDNLATSEVARNGLRAEKSMDTLGVLHELGWQKTIPIINSSNHVVKITETKVVRDRRNGCNGTANIHLDKSRLEPGESTVVHVSGAEQRCGEFTHQIFVATDPKNASIVIPLHGYVEQSIGVERPTILATEVVSGEIAIASIPIELPPNFICETVHVDFLQGPTLSWKPLPTPTGHAIRVEGRELPVGNNRTLLAIRASPNQNLVPSEVTVVMPVIDNITLTPPSVSFQRSNSLTEQQRQLKIKRIDGGSTVATVEIVSQSEFDEQVTATVNADTGIVEVRFLPLSLKPSLTKGKVMNARIVFADGRQHEFAILVN